MGYEAVKAVLASSQAKGSDRLVLMILASHADERLTCFPSRRTLCNEAAMTERNLIYCLKRLEALGELTISRGNGRGYLTTYTINVDHNNQDKRVQAIAPLSDAELPAGVAEKMQAAAPFPRDKGCNPTSKRVQNPVERVQSNVKKGAKSGNAYKEESSGNHHGNHHGESRAREEDPPFSTVVASPEQTGSICDAIVEIMPGLASDTRAQQDICLLVLSQHSGPDDVRRWATWLPTRFPGTIKNQFKFRDTFPEMLRETAEKTAGYWFVFYAAGHKDGARLSARVSDEIAREASWLDEQVGGTDRAVWRARGLLPQHFRRFWAEALKYSGFPTPEKVRTYWPQFTAWIAQQNGQLSKA